MEKVNEKQSVEEKVLNPKSGVPILFLNLIFTILEILAMIAGCVMLADEEGNSDGLGGILVCVSIVCLIVSIFIYAGLKTVGPNEARVFTLFGKYYGTILKSGYFFVNPFCSSVSPDYKKPLVSVSGAKEDSDNVDLKLNTKSTISLKTLTLINDKQKVNDLLGNPVIIGSVVIWKVEDPTKAVFNVEDYFEYLSTQTDSVIRNIARLYPYDVIEDDDDASGEITLRGSSQEIAERMEKELQEKVEFAGLRIEEVRINHLAYSEEIAAAMLQRQQATAIIAARQKIVDGAVSMVKMAIDKLGEEEVVVLDEERKAAMVSNLLVVLCSGKDTQPIVNSGSIY